MNDLPDIYAESNRKSSDWQAAVRSVAEKLRKLSPLRPTLALILGSGFNHVLHRLVVDAEIAYGKLPGFPGVGVSGHAGQLVIGRLAGTPVMVLNGRAHFYEGHAMSMITFPVRALARYGIRDLLLTNAAGGVNRRFRPGDFMIITDHINFMGTNPLRGTKPQPEEERFVDLSRVYELKLIGLLRRAGRETGIKLRSGTYLAVCGPSYETPAEICAFRRLGADAVGMSTVPEAIVARQCGLRVVALSCITNMAGDGLAGRGLSHHEVLATAARVKNLAAQLLSKFVKYLRKRQPGLAQDRKNHIEKEPGDRKLPVGRFGDEG
jgi:purine-nucleoside phosphorylase